MATARPKGTTRLVIWTAAVAVVALVFYLAHIATRTELPVRAYRIERGSIESSKSTNGKIQPMHNFEAHAPSPGSVRSVYIHEGDTVPAGKLLLVMDDSDARTRLAQARSALSGAENNLHLVTAGGTPDERFNFNGQVEQAQNEQANATQALATLENLSSKGAASGSEVAQAKQRLATANSQLQVLQQRQNGQGHAPGIPAAQAQVSEAQASVAGATEALAKTSVRAPFEGTVYYVPVQATDYVQQGDLLLLMADLSKLQVATYFDEPDLGALNVGQAVTIEWAAKPNKIWHGHIIRLASTVIRSQTRNVGVVICSIDDAHGDLLPDTNVTVHVTTNSVNNALFIPREALHPEQGLNYVYKIEHGKLHRVAVQVGTTLNLTQIQINSGISVGDVVALGSSTGQTLMNGMAVKILGQ